MQWLWNFDRSAQHFINVELHSPAMSALMRWFTYLGLDQFVVAAILILLVIRFTRRTGTQALLAYAIAGVSSLTIKSQIGRLRPGYPGDSVIVAPDERVFLSSFPSGHTVIVFALAFTLLLSLPGPRRVPIGLAAVALATLVGISRIYRGIHWPTDVVGSIALAWLASLLAWWIFNRGRAKASLHQAEEPA